MPFSIQSGADPESALKLAEVGIKAPLPGRRPATGVRSDPHRALLPRDGAAEDPDFAATDLAFRGCKGKIGGSVHVVVYTPLGPPLQDFAPAVHLHRSDVCARLDLNLERDASSRPFVRSSCAPSGQGRTMRGIRSAQHATGHQPDVAQLRRQSVHDVEKLHEGPKLRALHQAVAINQLCQGIFLQMPSEVPCHRRRPAEGSDVGVGDDYSVRVGARQPRAEQALHTMLAFAR